MQAAIKPTHSGKSSVKRCTLKIRTSLAVVYYAYMQPIVMI